MKQQFQHMVFIFSSLISGEPCGLGFEFSAKYSGDAEI